VCGFHPSGPLDRFRDCRQTVHAVKPASSADPAEVSPAVFVEGGDETGPKGPSQEVIAAVVEMKERNPSWGCPRIAQQIALAFRIGIDRDVVQRILAARYQAKPDSARPSWLTVPGSRKGQSVECGSVSVRIGRPPHVLGARRDGPLTRRIVGFGVHHDRVDGVALCLMFNHASCGQSLRTDLSADHDPLYCLLCRSRPSGQSLANVSPNTR
jgi:hypothetical protein